LKWGSTDESAELGVEEGFYPKGTKKNKKGLSLGEEGKKGQRGEGLRL